MLNQLQRYNIMHVNVFVCSTQHLNCAETVLISKTKAQSYAIEQRKVTILETICISSSLYNIHIFHLSNQWCHEAGWPLSTRKTVTINDEISVRVETSDCAPCSSHSSGIHDGYVCNSMLGKSILSETNFTIIGAQSELWPRGFATFHH